MVIDAPEILRPVIPGLSAPLAKTGYGQYLLWLIDGH
jgi:hypothetical protein